MGYLFCAILDIDENKEDIMNKLMNGLGVILFIAFLLSFVIPSINDYKYYFLGLAVLLSILTLSQEVKRSEK